MLRGCRDLLYSHTHLTIEKEPQATGSSTFACLVTTGPPLGRGPPCSRNYFERKESRENETMPFVAEELRRGTERREKPELHRTELMEERNFLVKLLACSCYMRFIVGIMHRVVTVVWRRCTPGGVSLVGSPLWVSTSGGTPPGSGGVRLPIPGTPR